MKKQIKNKEEKQLKNWMLDTTVFSWFFVILSSFFILAIVFLGTYSFLKINNGTEQDILNDVAVTSYLVSINSYSDASFLSNVLENNSTKEVLWFKLIIPSVYKLTILISIIVVCVYFMKLTKNVKTSSDLFTDEKLKIANLLRKYLNIVLFLFILLGMNVFVMIVYEVCTEIIYYLFKQCVTFNQIKTKGKE